jgi:hypothetical protein
MHSDTEATIAQGRSGHRPRARRLLHRLALAAALWIVPQPADEQANAEPAQRRSDSSTRPPRRGHRSASTIARSIRILPPQRSSPACSAR